MQQANNGLEPVNPSQVLTEISTAVPLECSGQLIVIGSLAVGFHYFKNQGDMSVRTKDADCLLSPRQHAIDSGVSITERLIESGWNYAQEESGRAPGDASTPDHELPAVRLWPPNSTQWFIELLTEPDSSEQIAKQWVRINTKHGDFGLCSFRYLALLSHDPEMTDMGIRVARPEMMALANMLSHPRIGSEKMSAGFAGRPEIKRSNKDLGRVLAIAYLAMREDENALLNWPNLWLVALQSKFADQAVALAMQAGNGIRELLESDFDIEQAYFTCTNGLLSAIQITPEQFKIAGARLLQDAIVSLEESGTST
jgi:hypothetical protein